MDFNNILKKSFYKYLDFGSRSNQKLKVLHGDIAKALMDELDDNYKVYSIDLAKGVEKLVIGSFMNKKIDITIAKKIDDEWIDICGIGIKFVMSNYAQNSNNYFESMLGETANIRMNEIPYFQLFVVETNVPYFTDEGEIKNWEQISEHHLSKYQQASYIDVLTHLHIPNKMFLYVCKKEFANGKDITKCKNRNEYVNFCKANEFSYVSTKENIDLKFGKNIIFNNMDNFVSEILKVVKKIN